MVSKMMKVIVCVVMCLLTTTMGAYNIGMGKGDITGPAAEVGMMGYADLAQKSAGLLNRLYARAFIIHDPESNQRVVFVNCDLQSVMQLVHQEVIHQISAQYPGLYSEQNIILHATHTHAGPGGASAYFLYDATVLGYINENFNVIVHGIVKAIVAAHDSIAPGIIRFNKGQITDVGKNRSPLAYLANPPEERNQYATDRDLDMRMLHFYDLENKLRGILSWYPVHPTSLTRYNKLVSGDNKGYAEFLVEEKYPGVVVGIGISNAADVSPNRIDNGDGTFKGEGATDVESAEIVGSRQAAEVFKLLDAPTEEIKGSILSLQSYVDYSKVKLQGRTATPSDPYADTTCPAVVGQNMAAGTEDGRGIGGFKEGDLKANVLFRAIGGIIKEAPQSVKDCHTPNKVPLLAVGLMQPVPWVPNILPLQVVKIGQFGLAVTNFEVSTMSGRRIRAAMTKALADAGVTEVEIVSVSNAYAQYLTTREEYMTQHYEGASTLFGPNQLAAVTQELVRIAASVVNSSIPLDKGPEPRQFDRSKLLNFQSGVFMDTAGWGKQFGDVRTDVNGTYGIGELVSVSFRGAHPKNQFEKIQSFCDVERLEPSGKWTTILQDKHWDVRYRWFRHMVAESRSVCEWNIRPTNPTSIAGRYRIRHRGYSKPAVGRITYYEGVSSEFTVA